MDSKIRLCKGINVDREYNNVINYTEAQMLALCESNTHLVTSSNTYSFIDYSKKIIRVDFPYDECLQCNYIAFQNPHYSNKWFFAWIDDIVYKGDKITYITFTIDAWSTWFNNITVKKCFVKRHHVNNDTIGLHTIPENLNVEKVIEESHYDSALYVANYVIVESTYTPGSQGGTDFDGVTQVDGQIIGSRLFAFFIRADMSHLSNFIRRLNQDSKIDSIINMYIAPAAILQNLIDFQFMYEGEPYTCQIVYPSTTPKELTNTRPKLHNFTGISVKNNKCFVYPYNYLYVTNHNGNDNIYKYEDFSSENCTFKIISTTNNGCSIRCIPQNYKGIEDNDDESIPLGKLPTVSWTSDAYTNWLTQQAVNIPTKISQGIISAALAFTAGGIYGVAASAAATTASLIGEFYKASLLPNVEQGSNTADVTWARGQNTFTFRHMRAANEYLAIVDDYFTRFGYAIKKLEVPNITGRQYWNYIEIGEIEEIGTGDVPQQFMDIINKTCRKGVTIWHNHDNIGNFSLNNSIV